MAAVAVSVIPYPSSTGTPQAKKNSRISGAIGAAPDVAWRSCPPNAARTFLNSFSSAPSKCACSSGGTSCPAACNARTAKPTCVAALICSASPWAVTSV